MTLGELILAYRTDAFDQVAPYLASDAQVKLWLNEAQDEAAVRARLLRETQDDCMCVIDVWADESVYELHDAVYEIDYIAFRATGAAERTPLELVSTGWLDKNQSGWRDRTGCPRWAIQDERTIRLAPTPSVAGEVLLEVYRLPKETMDDDDDEPEIHRANHRSLVDWALFRAFSIPDSDQFDDDRSARALGRFTARFGLRPDADLRRMTRHDAEHHNVAILP